MEGISHEAISLAGHLKLSKLIVLFDDNGISIDGPTSLSVSDDQLGRFTASGWAVTRVDGPDAEADAAAIAAARARDRPRSAEHKSVLKSIMRISYAALCVTTKKLHTYIT